MVTQPDRPVGRKRILTPTPVKQKAMEHGIPVFQPEKIKEDYDQVLAWNPDLIVTAAFGQIIPKILLDAPKHGCINVHASLLPKYRGGAPIHKAIIDGDVKSVKCEGAVEVRGSAGTIDCGGSCTVVGNVKGSIDAGGSVTCGNVGGDIDAGGSVMYRE